MQQDGEIPEVREASIVALGKFNPAIFQPQWYGATKLIRPEEADNAAIEVILNELTVFSTEWFKIQITQDRFLISTLDPTKNLPLRDLAVGTFKILEHTPITAVGFNSIQDFAMPSGEEWHTIGHYYAPKPSWLKVLNKPGLRLLVMEGTRQGSDANPISVRLEPSSKMEHGVRVAINEHYNLDPKTSAQERMRGFLHIIEAAWEPFLKYADDAAQHLLREARTSTNG